MCQHIWYGLNPDISYYSNCLLVLPNWLLIILRSFVWVLLLPNSSHKKLSVIRLRTVYNSHPIPRIMSCCLQPLPVRNHPPLSSAVLASEVWLYFQSFILVLSNVCAPFQLHAKQIFNIFFFVNLSHPFIFIHAQSFYIYC